uniref:Anoctamin n=2 Tax=Cacopsylla melanoneura TaxID=428564 RepID=A0A8D8ZHJ1_9HEMI
MGVDKGDLYDEVPGTCQYRGYRNGPDHSDQYGLSPQYWHVFAARLAFVVIFEHIIFALTGLMAYIIPSIPSELRTQIKRERLLMKEAQYEHTASYQKENDEYDDLLNAIRNSRSGTRLSEVIEKKNWGQRIRQFSWASSSKKDPLTTVSTLTVAESVDSPKIET